MVVSEIISGLGNQMFQYAAGLSLSERLNVPLLLEISWFDDTSKHQTPRNFELSNYNIDLSFADAALIDRDFRFKGSNLMQRIRNKWNRTQPLHRQRIYQEAHFHYDTNFDQLTSPVMISGYWQSERYFKPIESIIRETFILDIPKHLEHWVSSMQEGISVSIHIRRGDMISNPDVTRVHGYCNLDYYLRAISFMNERYNKVRYFVFSDDLAWCKSNLPAELDLVFVEGNSGNEAYWDIQLMRNCHHHIIANSSFSWWGAWLNPTKEKIVIAPVQWFAQSPHQTHDLIPSSWVRL
jgi:hypothetical protein